MKFVSDKSENTNSEEEAEGNPLETRSTDETTQLLQTAVREQPKTDTGTAAWQIIVSIVLVAESITAVPPTSSINDSQSNSIAKMKMEINQLSQTVNCHIIQSKAESASLKSGIATSMAEVEKK